MLGLIIKDFLYLKNIWKNILVMFIGAVIVSVTTDNYLFVISVVPLMLVTCGINNFQADEFYKTEAYTICYPISRKGIVQSKYLFTFISFILAVIIGFVIYLIFKIFVNPMSLDISVFFYLVMLLVIGLIIDFIFYPIIYKYGCEKSSFVLISIVIITDAIISFGGIVLNMFNIYIDYGFIIGLFLENIYVILIGVTLFIVIISYILSVKIYERQNF